MEKVSDTASAGIKVSREDTFFLKLKATILIMFLSYFKNLSLSAAASGLIIIKRIHISI